MIIIYITGYIASLWFLLGLIKWNKQRVLMEDLLVGMLISLLSWLMVLIICGILIYDYINDHFDWEKFKKIKLF